MTLKPDTKAKLSTSWTVVMFNMAYADILSLYIHNIHEELAEFAENNSISQLMLGGAIVLEAPILIIFFTRILHSRNPMHAPYYLDGMEVE